MDNTEIEKVFNSWSKTEVEDGKSFDDFLRIGDAPLWWFYKRFIQMNMLPGMEKFSDVLKRVNDNEKAENKAAKVLLMRKGFALNEKAKIKFAGKKNPTKERMSILFLTYSDHVSPNKEIYRVEKVRRKIEEAGLRSFVLVADPISKRAIKKLKNQENTLYFPSCKLKIL